MAKMKKKASLPKKAPERLLEIIEPEDVPTFYANRVGLQVSTWDFRFSFEKILEATEKKQTSKVLAVVYIAPSFLKAIRNVIDRQIAVYEETHAKIPDIEAISKKSGH